MEYVATIGFYDGVHRGHRFLIQQTVNEAKRRNLPPMLITFDRHPMSVINPDNVPECLNTLEERYVLLEQILRQYAGMDVAGRVVVLRFTREMSGMTACDFMDKILRSEYGVKTLIMGYDHHFGHGGGTYQQCAEWGRKLNMDVLLAKELTGEQISSSSIRRYIKDGEMESANHLLGYPFQLQGCVVAGHKVGHTIGFPTANIQIADEKLLPPGGAYAVKVVTEQDGTHMGMMNIGCRPTFHNGNKRSIEVHLLDFDGNLYGSRLCVLIFYRLRVEKEFCSVEALSLQLQKDAEETRNYFNRL